METYQVVLVFGDYGKTQEWYVVNVKTKKVQSAWKLLLDATRTAKALNLREKMLAS